MNSSLFPRINNISFAETGNFLLIAGPCVVESRDMVFETATQLKSMCTDLQIPLIFKASYRKANRSRLQSFSGIGDDKALRILSDVRDELHLPVLTDIHETKEVDAVSQVADVLQIPAFLCRQTELIVKAAQAGKPVNIKKGQFLAPESMRFVCEKAVEAGNSDILITERGTSFGYGDLIVDFRGIPIMKQFGFPVILDITHSLQVPNQPDGVTGGRPALIETMARAGMASGVDGLFMETHPDPSSALSDGANMLPLAQAREMLSGLLKLHQFIQSIATLKS